MRQITITIMVPDGVEVAVQQSGGGASQFRSTPPENPGGGCPVHGMDWKWVPPGVSKTKTNPDGTPKAYAGFWACPERGCSEKPQPGDVLTDVTSSEFPLPF